MAKLLIIGGTGFFGKSILDSFKRGLLTKFEITNIVVLARNVEKFKEEFPELIFDGVQLLNGDIGSLNSLPEADFVIHAAASTNMNDYGDSVDFLFQNNFRNIISNFCALALKYYPKSKILYCSSGAVYGKQPLSIEKIDENFPFRDDLSDLSIEKQNYCLSKRFAEKQIIDLGKLGLNVSIARCFAFSGKYLPKDQHYALGNFIGQGEKGENIIVKTKGIVYRSYLDSDELVISLMKILNVSSNYCPVYNVGSDNQISIYDLARSLSSKYSVDCEFLDYNDKVVIDRYVPNIDKLRTLLY
jgi:dTDP-glucose 4,6-dehydratase